MRKEVSWGNQFPWLNVSILWREKRVMNPSKGEVRRSSTICLFVLVNHK